MKFKLTSLNASIALMFAVAAMPVQAQTAKEFEELRAEMKKLRAELEALKGARTAAPAAPAAQPETSNAALVERIEQVELRAKDAVVAGDIPGSFRLPGSETSLRIYGHAELNMVHELKGDNSDMDYATFLPYAPINDVSPNAGRKGRNFIHARTTRLGIEASTPTQYGPLGIKVEGDFNNDPRTGNSAASGDIEFGNIGSIYTQQATNSYNFRLRHAYGQVGGFLVGQTWSTFMDVDNSPETVDFNGPIGSTFIRQPQIRYTYNTPSIGALTVAIENSNSYVLDSTASLTPAGFSHVPDFVVRWDKGFDWGAISVRGVSHEHRLKGVIDDNGDSQSLSRRGYGIAASGLIKTIGDDFMTWAVTGGTGIGRYFNYIEGAFYDGGENRILMEKAVGVVLGYQHKASDSLRFNAAVGAQKNYNNEYTDFAITNDLHRAAGAGGRFAINRKLWQAHLGFFWTPVSGVDLGAEYIHGRRTTLAGEDGDMSRVNLSARYSFN